MLLKLKQTLQIIKKGTFLWWLKHAWKGTRCSCPSLTQTDPRTAANQPANQAGKPVQPWPGSIRGGISDLSIVILSLNDNGPTSPRGAADGCRVPQSTAPIPHLGPGGPDSRWGVRWSRCHGLGKTQVAHSNLAQTTPAGLWWLRLCFASRPTGDLNGATPQ